jgi:hypothetical protein
MSKYKTNSPLASGAIVKHYKQLYKKKYDSDNSYASSGKKPLKRWFNEKWVSTNPIVGADADTYQVFRPTKKVDKNTPVLLQDISQSELRNAVSEKQNKPINKRLKIFTQHAKRGGKISSSDLKSLLDASYDNKNQGTADFVKDDSISSPTSKVFHNAKTGQTVVAHRGTEGTLSDWSNNAIYALQGEKGYRSTSRFKEAEKVQRAAEQKYGANNITTIGHSQGGLQAELLGKNTKETITLNKATRPWSNTKADNQYDIRTTSDLVSSFNPFQPKSERDITLKSPTYNPLSEHSIDT